MIKTREQFEERLKKLKEKYKGEVPLSYVVGYTIAIDDVLKLIEDEGGCFEK